ncbi:MAG TPA: ribosome silencing factor [archaeon]|nr:ribosome silencing factor [archaeon]
MTRKKTALKENKSQKKIRELVFFAGECCLEKKGDDVVVLNLRKVSDVTDYFLICGGYTDIHVRAVTEHMIESMKKRYNISPWHVEGMENGRWVLVDYIDFVIHIFQPETRDFYQLERLWADAERFEISDEQVNSETG